MFLVCVPIDKFESTYRWKECYFLKWFADSLGSWDAQIERKWTTTIFFCVDNKKNVHLAIP